MPVQLTPQDIARLKPLHPDMEALVLLAALHCDQPFVVFEGMRTMQRQKQYVAKGVSKTLRSYHLVGLAVDLVPLLPNGKGKLQPTWNAAACRVIAKAMADAAYELRKQDPYFTGVTWGGSWKFFDGPHFQLNVPYEAHARTKEYLKAGNTKTVPPSAGSYINQRTMPHTHSNAVSRMPVDNGVREAQLDLNRLRSLMPTTDRPLGSVSPSPPELLVVDGKYGVKTEAAVRKVQAWLGLKVDGIYGPRTQGAVRERIQHLTQHLELQARLSSPSGDVVQDPALAPAVKPRPLTLESRAATMVVPNDPPKRSSPMQGYKTYIVALAAILTALAGYLNEQITLAEFIASVFAAISSMTIRHGINTTVGRALDGVLGGERTPR